MSERSTNIIEQIFEMAKEREKTDSSVNFDVYTQENQLKPQFAEVCCRWSDAAYRGDWDDILKIVAANIWNAPSLANLTRLRKKDHNPNHKPSGYTVLHQAAYNGAPEEIARALIALGCFRRLRTTDGRAETPVDIARRQGSMHLIDILTPPPDLLPHISDQDLSIIQECFRKVVIEEARGIFKPEEMKLVPLALMREVKKIYMPIPGMYGGFNLRWEGDHLVTESWCRVAGGSGKTNHISVEGAKLVDEGWG